MARKQKVLTTAEKNIRGNRINKVLDPLDEGSTIVDSSAQKNIKVDDLSYGDAFYYNMMTAPTDCENQTDKEYILRKGFIKVTANPITGNPILLNDKVAGDNAELIEFNCSIAKELSVSHLSEKYAKDLYRKVENDPSKYVGYTTRHKINTDMASIFHNLAVNAFTKVYTHANRMFVMAVKNSLDRLTKHLQTVSDVAVYGNRNSLYMYSTIDKNKYTVTLELPVVFDLALLLGYGGGHQNYYNKNPQYTGRRISSPYYTQDHSITEYAKPLYSVGTLCNLEDYSDNEFDVMLGSILAIMGQNFNLFTLVLSDFRIVLNNMPGLAADEKEAIVDYLMASYNVTQAELITALENTVYVLWCEASKYNFFIPENDDEDYY